MKISRTKLLPRTTNVRDSWLCVIATEGQETEKRYFAMFQNSRVEVYILPTLEDNKSSPNYVLDRLELEKEKYDFGPQDQLWLMIDVDRWHTQNKLADVCREAKRRGIGLAVSNPCFELWLWLHYADADAMFDDSMFNNDALTGKAKYPTPKDRLRKLLGSYNESNLDVDKFKPLVNDAVRRAEQLDTDVKALWPAHPGTHVYKVVASLPRTA